MLTPIRLSLLVFIAIGMATVYGLRKKKESLGTGYRSVCGSGHRRMHRRFPCSFLRTPHGRLQLLAVCLPSGASALPPFLYKRRTKATQKQVSSTELHCFNTFYSAFSGNTTKFRLSSITFGTLFANTFCKQSYSDIQKS